MSTTTDTETLSNSPIPPHPNPTPLTKASIKIDRALPSDAPAIANLGAEVFTATFGPMIPSADLHTFLHTTYTPASIHADLTSPNIQTFVARDVATNKILAFVQLVRKDSGACGAGPGGEMRRLYVDVGAQGRGIGRRLIEVVEGAARDKGLVYLWLLVWEGNAVAQGLYGRMGFGRVGEMGFWVGGSRYEDWVFVKRL